MLRPALNVVDLLVDHGEESDRREKPEEPRDHLNHEVSRKHHFTNERVSDKHPEDTGIKHQSDPTKFVQQQRECHSVRQRRNIRDQQHIGLHGWLQIEREFR